MIMYIQSPSILRTFLKPMPLLNIKKKCPDFWKKGSVCVHLWVKFSIQNAVLRVSRRKDSKMFPCNGSKFSIQNAVLRASRRKDSKMFPCNGSLSNVFTKSISKCPPLPPFVLKSFWLHNCTNALFFLQNSPS